MPCSVLIGCKQSVLSAVTSTGAVPEAVPEAFEAAAWPEQVELCTTPAWPEEVEVDLGADIPELGDFDLPPPAIEFHLQQYAEWRNYRGIHLRVGTTSDEFEKQFEQRPAHPSYWTEEAWTKWMENREELQSRTCGLETMWRTTGNDKANIEEYKEARESKPEWRFEPGTMITKTHGAVKSPTKKKAAKRQRVQ